MSDRDIPRTDRFLELIAVLFLGITTVGTAWCGFQSSRWNGDAGELGLVASEQRIEASRLFGLATQRVTYDSIVVAKYAEALAEDDPELIQFYRQSVVRPDFLPVLDRWEASFRAGDTAVGVFEDQAYLDAEFADYETAVAEAERATDESQHANDVSDEYVGTTILLAVALFFAGVMSSFKYRPARALLLVAAMGAVAVAATRLVDLPIS